MPRFPAISPSVASIRGSIYSALARRLEHHRGETYPLHIGDTWMEPPEGCRMEDLRVKEHPGMHRYAPPQGIPQLLDALVERTRERTGVETERRQILVAAGATGALGAVVGATVSPGEEVLLLAPYWPLISGIVRSFHGRPVAVPALGAVDSGETLLEALEAGLSERTVAVYLNTPNNPSGRLLPTAWLEALVDWCRRRELWIYADEVYEDYVYRGRHLYARSLAPERTFSVHSFSKAFGMAGNRCGWLAGPIGLVDQLRKVSTHTFYSTPTAAQLAAVRALDGRGDAWVQAARPLYRQLGEEAAALLGAPSPEGSTFLFLDVASSLDERGLAGLLEDCAERGLLVAPGPSFGPYPHHIRICYTAAPPEITRRGVRLLAKLLAD